METSRIVNESETEDEPSLDLSYSSSEFEYDEVDEFDDNSENPDDVAPQASYRGDIRPYDFEPYADQPDDDSTSEDSQDTEMENQERLRDAQLWCTCNKCIIMPTTTECICCTENQKIVARMDAHNSRHTDRAIKCITDHPGFRSVCLDEFVLETAYYQYRQQYGIPIQRQNDRFRYTAYRQFVRWIWGVLGKEIRVVIPSCAVTCIRENYPSEDGTYTGFKFAD